MGTISEETWRRNRFEEQLRRECKYDRRDISREGAFDKNRKGVAHGLDAWNVEQQSRHWLQSDLKKPQILTALSTLVQPLS